MNLEIVATNHDFNGEPAILGVAYINGHKYACCEIISTESFKIARKPYIECVFLGLRKSFKRSAERDFGIDVPLDNITVKNELSNLQILEP